MNPGEVVKRVVTVAGTGSYLPERVLTNDDLAKMVDTSDEWIRSRTGMRERHIAREDETTSGMAAIASRRALEDAGIAASDIGLIVVGTVTPDMVFPSTACFVQHQVGARDAFCFDLEAACSGFLYSLETARRYVETGAVNTALVIGAEKLSTVTDWEDRGTCVLFGDGAGAVVVKATQAGRGIISSVMGSDGSLTELLNIPGGGSLHPVSRTTLEQRMHYIKMNGKEVFKHAVRCMCDAAQQVLDKCGCTVEDVKCIVPHQANMRIIQAIADRLGTTLDKFYLNIERVGNMSSASVPVALDEAARGGRIHAGDLVLFVTFGGGFTWGATLLEWGK